MAKLTLSELIEQEAELAEQIKAVHAYMKAFYNYSTVINKTLENAIAIKNVDFANVDEPLLMQPKETKPEKVKNALRLIQPAKSKAVAEKMIQMYHEYNNDLEKALKDARLYISALKGKGEVEEVEIGIGKVGSTYRVKE